MRILLVKDVQNLGRAGDVKDVSDGYARNFLIQKNLAVPATGVLVDKVRKEQQEREVKLARDNTKAEGLKEKLEQLTITLKAKASKNNLFASIHEAEIVEALKNKIDHSFDPKQILIKQPIKTLGEHLVEVKFRPDLTATLKVKVEAL